jgi:hypothetical protein
MIFNSSGNEAGRQKDKPDPGTRFFVLSLFAYEACAALVSPRPHCSLARCAGIYR